MTNSHLQRWRNSIKFNCRRQFSWVASAS